MRKSLVGELVGPVLGHHRGADEGRPAAADSLAGRALHEAAREVRNLLAL